MELSTLLLFFAVLACPVGMGLMMWMMNRNMGSNHATSSHISGSDRLQALHQQRRQLEQEIAAVEQIVALEAEKEALTRTRSASADTAHLQSVESASR
ncbi:MAG: hypothetical protein DYG89_11445 [Caldilinea sp. CFX5]|nr:hypothetical protein [Caldilinea sp. CFX5]